MQFSPGSFSAMLRASKPGASVGYDSGSTDNVARFQQELCFLRQDSCLLKSEECVM